MNFAEVHRLKKTYGNGFAVDDVSFEIARGESWGLLGPNGAGKSTTILMIATLLKPTAGDVLVHGHSVTREPARVQRMTGLVPQDIALYPALTARENLLFFGRMYGLGGRELHNRADEILEITGLADRARQRIDQFSGGMKRRLNIGVGLINNPELLILDEPTVGIDPQSRRYILDTVKRLNSQGTTVLYTSHYMEEAEYLCDRVGIIDHGRLIAQGTREELIRMAGAGERLEIDIDGLGTAVLDELRRLSGVHEVTYQEDQLSIQAAGASALLSAVFARIEQNGCRVKSVEIREPNLESVFLYLTGKELRN